MFARPAVWLLVDPGGGEPLAIGFLDQSRADQAEAVSDRGRDKAQLIGETVFEPQNAPPQPADRSSPCVPNAPPVPRLRLERGVRPGRIDTLIKAGGVLGAQPGDLLAGIDWVPGRD